MVCLCFFCLDDPAGLEVERSALWGTISLSLVAPLAVDSTLDLGSPLASPSRKKSLSLSVDVAIHDDLLSPAAKGSTTSRAGDLESGADEAIP